VERELLKLVHTRDWLYEKNFATQIDMLGNLILPLPQPGAFQPWVMADKWPAILAPAARSKATLGYSVVENPNGFCKYCPPRWFYSFSRY